MITKSPYDFGVVFASMNHDGSRHFEELSHEDARAKKHAVLLGKHPEVKAFKIFATSNRRADWISKTDAPAEAEAPKKAKKPAAE